jgi:hypothetical protein
MAMNDPKQLVEQFAKNVAAQTDAISRGDPKAGNKHARRYIQAFERLRSMGDKGRDALVPLMREGRSDVRGMAAAFLLRHCTEEAICVLKELGAGEGVVAFSARESLKRWQEGAWQLDPE